MCPAEDKLGGNFVGFMAAAAGWGHLGVAGSALGTAVESQGPAAWVGPGGALGLGALHSSRTPPGCARPEAGAPSCLHCAVGLEVGSVAIGGAEGMGAAARLRSRTEVGGGLGGAGARPLRAGDRRHLAGLRAPSHP